MESGMGKRQNYNVKEFFLNVQNNYTGNSVARNLHKSETWINL